jgi:hypothetical protein
MRRTLEVHPGDELQVVIASDEEIVIIGKDTGVRVKVKAEAEKIDPVDTYRRYDALIEEDTDVRGKSNTKREKFQPVDPYDERPRD